MKVFEFRNTPLVLKADKVSKAQQRIYETLVSMGGFLYPVLVEFPFGFSKTYYMPFFSIEQVRQMIDGETADVVKAINKRHAGENADPSYYIYKKVAPVAHLKLSLCIHEGQGNMVNTDATMSVESVMHLIQQIEENDFLTLRDIKEYCPAIYKEFHLACPDIKDDCLVTSGKLDYITTVLYDDEPASDEIASYDIEGGIRHLVATVDEDSITIDEETAVDGDIEQNGTLVIDDIEALHHLMNASRSASVLQALKLYASNCEASISNLSSAFDDDQIAYTITA